MDRPRRSSLLASFLLVLLPLLQDVRSSEDDAVVDLPMGRIRGIRKTVLGKDLNVFLGIPYAKPPLGELRYRKPVNIERYREEIIANSLSKACFQIDPFVEDGAEYYKKLNMSEDCLYLNIWVPVLKDLNTEPKSVLVWIHGGGFTEGTASDLRFNGQVIAAHGEVIVVSFNYRVGAMGFLNGATPDEPGNIGLYDQTLALRWIRNNIAYFGGNPESVTIFGVCAGGFSVGFHLTSPISEGLFKRGILQSGVANTPLYHYEYKDSIETTKSFARHAKCNEPDSDFENNPIPILECLKSKSPEELSKAEYLVRKRNRFYAHFLPVLGEDFIPYKSVKPFSIPKYIHTKDFIIGITANGGTGFVFDYFSDVIEEGNVTKSKAYEVLVPFLKHPGKVKNVTEKMDYYFKDIIEHDQVSVKRAMSDLLTDWLIRCPSYIFSNVLAKSHSLVYFYYFNHFSSSLENDPNKDWLGVPYYSDFKYVFGHPFMQVDFPYKDDYTEGEERFSLEMIDLWSSYARNGVPRSPRHYYWLNWQPPHTPVLQLNATSASILPLPGLQACHLWNS